MGVLLNKGIYDAVEIGHLIGADPDTVIRWSLPDGRLPRLAQPDAGRFTFLDLVSLHVVRILRERRVPLAAIRQAQETLAAECGTPWPFASQKLATAGRSVLADLDEWVDVGKGGQGTLQPIVNLYLKDIEYDEAGMAAVWVPRPGVSVNPRIQAGAPCVQGTRIPTADIRLLAESGEDASDIASDLDLDLRQVRSALAFESSMTRAA